MIALEEPDKGYAWVVLLGSCVINTILSGMARMIGLLYVAIIDEYGVTRKVASFPFSFRNAVRYIAGPLTGVLGQTYGIRKVTFWGGVIAATGSILCATAPTVDWIVLWWGIVHGMGFAFANTLFQVVINQYFEKHRASACGIVLSGACVGALIFPLMIESMLHEYGFFGCFLLLGGLFLNVLPPSLLLKVPQWIEFPEAYARKRAFLSKLSTNMLENKKESCSIFHIHNPNKEVSQKTLMTLSMTKMSQKDERLSFLTRNVNCDQSNIICKLYHPIDHDEQHNQKGRFINLQNGILNSAFVPDSEKQNRKQTEEKTSETKSVQNETQDGLMKNLLKIPLLYLNPIYNLISFSLAVYFAAFLPVLTVIVDYTRDKGIPRYYEQFLIHAFTIGDLVGRLCFGWVTDRKCLSLASIMILSFVAQGIFTALLPLSKSAFINMIILGLYGITAGTIFAHIPVLVHKYVDKNNQSIAIGCVGLFSSISAFGIPPLIGYYRDNVGSYDGLFYILAAFSLIPAGLWLLVSLCEAVKEKNQEQDTKL